MDPNLNCLFHKCQIWAPPRAKWMYREVWTNELKILWCWELYPVTHAWHMCSRWCAFDPIRSQQWCLTICPAMAPRIVYGRARNLCQVPVATRWQLASRRRLLEIAWEEDDSLVVQRSVITGHEIGSLRKVAPNQSQFCIAMRVTNTSLMVSFCVRGIEFRNGLGQFLRHAHALRTLVRV